MSDIFMPSNHTVSATLLYSMIGQQYLDDWMSASKKVHNSLGSYQMCNWKTPWLTLSFCSPCHPHLVGRTARRNQRGNFFKIIICCEAAWQQLAPSFSLLSQNLKKRWCGFQAGADRNLWLLPIHASHIGWIACPPRRNLKHLWQRSWSKDWCYIWIPHLMDGSRHESSSREGVRGSGRRFYLSPSAVVTVRSWTKCP